MDVGAGREEGEESSSGGAEDVTLPDTVHTSEGGGSKGVWVDGQAEGEQRLELLNSELLSGWHWSGHGSLCGGVDERRCWSEAGEIWEYVARSNTRTSREWTESGVW